MILQVILKNMIKDMSRQSLIQSSCMLLQRLHLCSNLWIKACVTRSYDALHNHLRRCFMAPKKAEPKPPAPATEKYDYTRTAGPSPADPIPEIPGHWGRLATANMWQRNPAEAAGRGPTNMGHGHAA